ncbi:Phenylalanine-specific permease [Sphingobium sp. AntQ-1]|uniref:APC family permease n=1 Tax=Sphingobium sp. AntQ-1 TaxID=2930091 RepID=UPI00234FA33D|nr:APC family permease [Sphingobium sp. AntQ-1]WCP14426.1 Phenylalanine-specific permease [Sphingobium sp. AntQ-1]
MNVAAEPALKRGVTGPGYFALAFGTIVGSAWMVLMGEWVAPAGPGGAVLAFLGMTLLMVPVAAAYAELVARVPRAGAEFVFVEKAFGPWSGFVTGWYLTLYFVGIAAFEGLALSWFLENLAPSLSGQAPLYTLLGRPITAMDLIVGLAGAVVMTILNASGATIAVGFQKIVTFAFLAASAVLVLLGFAQGDTGNWHPLFESAQDRSFAGGMFVMLGVAGMWLSGFQTAASAVEERAPGTSFHTVARAMMAAVAVAALFYSLIILASASLAPWRDLTSGALPVTAAFDHALAGGLATKAIILVAMASLLKTWNAMHLSATRVILAQARAGFLPASLALIDARTGAPRRAALLVGLWTCLGVLAGRGAIGPIISMGTMCTTAIAAVAMLALMRLRSRDKGATPPAFVLAGGSPLLVAISIGAAVVASAAIATPFGVSDGMPVEIWLMLGWLALGGGMVMAQRLLMGAPTVQPA